MTPHLAGQEELVIPHLAGQTAVGVRPGMLPPPMDAAIVTVSVAPRGETNPSSEGLASPVFELDRVNVFYGKAHAVRDVTLDIGQNRITALIGPSGCGKSTLLRCLNRTNDLIQGARVSGVVAYHGLDILGADIDVTPRPKATSRATSSVAPTACGPTRAACSGCKPT